MKLFFRPKILEGENVKNYVAFMGSLRIEPSLKTASRIQKVTVHTNMRMIEPW